MEFVQRFAPFGGALFIVLLIASFFALGAVGTVDGEPAASWGASLVARGHWAQLSGHLHALAGMSLAAFAWALTRPTASGSDDAIRSWGRFAGIAWAASFILGGAILFAAPEIAGYQQHPEGAKTASILGHLMYANSIAAFLGAGFALAIGLARPAFLPAWFRPLSLTLGGLGMAVTLLGSIGGIGLLGMGPVALWLVVAAVVVPFRNWGA